MSTKQSCAMDLRPAARAAQRLFTANQVLFVIALVFGVTLGIVLAADWASKGADGYMRTAADNAVRAALLGGLFLYALLFALMDYPRRYWIGVALAAAQVAATLIVWAVIAVAQESGADAENVAAAALIVGPIVSGSACRSPAAGGC